ncbi:MAG: hypothetical protein WA239_20940 [Candidatus Sulfotelmatobacter sp.]
MAHALWHSPRATKLGLYEVVTPLGAGGMGEVYRTRYAARPPVSAIEILSNAHLSDRRLFA